MVPGRWWRSREAGDNDIKLRRIELTSNQARSSRTKLCNCCLTGAKENARAAKHRGLSHSKISFLVIDKCTCRMWSEGRLKCFACSRSMKTTKETLVSVTVLPFDRSPRDDLESVSAQSKIILFNIPLFLRLHAGVLRNYHQTCRQMFQSRRRGGNRCLG